MAIAMATAMVTDRPNALEMLARSSSLRIALVGLATLIALIFVLAPTIAITVGRSDPDFGLKVWPFSAVSQARKAEQLITADLNPSAIAQADMLSRAALRHEPLNVTAARIQAIIAAARGRESATLKWLNYAESLSRRDFAVQAMMIEAAVSRGDAKEALVHYDRALRGNKAAGDILYPVLSGSTEDAAILPLLADLLAKRPEWWYDFTVLWQSRSPAPQPEPLFTITMAEKLDVSVPRERMLAISAMQRMVATGRADLAARLHDSIIEPGAAIAASFDDGGFDARDSLPPFAWEFSSQIGLNGIVENREGQDRPVLTIDAADSQRGSVAWHLVRLPAGTYRLDFRVGDVAQDGVVPAVSVTCTGAPEPLVSQSIRQGSPPARNLEFKVSQGCATQTVTISGAAGSNDNLPRPWIADVKLKRLN